MAATRSCSCSNWRTKRNSIWKWCSYRNKEAFDAGVTSEKFAARDAGADGNNLRVVIVDRGADFKSLRQVTVLLLVVHTQTITP